MFQSWLYLVLIQYLLDKGNGMKKKKPRKPTKFNGTVDIDLSCNHEFDKEVDIYINGRFEIEGLKQLKKVHGWLGRAIAWLEYEGEK